MHHNADTARAGASIVILSQPIKIHPTTEQDVLKLREEHPNLANPDHGTDAGHFTDWDMANAGVQNLISQLTEAAHFYGSLCMWKANLRPPAGYDVSGGVTKETGVSVMMQETVGVGGSGHARAPKKELTVEMLRKLIEDVTLQCALGKECGFDGVWLHCGYRGSPGARLLSPLTNRRTDQYGGSHENRARFIIEMAEAIKKRCGRDFSSW
jgi:2,4-dienoyl-CoA reductase-like NADH-dependent reductase (Old Yellow Enzyme family)